MGAQRHRSADIATVVSGVLRAVSVCAPAALLTAPATLVRAGEPTALAKDIPAQPLAQALAAFASQTGLQVVYVSGVLRNQKSHAVAAGLSANDALTLLLQGTGLRFDYLTARSVRILAGNVNAAAKTSAPSDLAEREPLEQVIVTATRHAENLQNVPMTVQVLTGDVLASFRTLDDFVRYVPGVTVQGTGPGQDNIYIRGLSIPGGARGLQGQGSVGLFASVAIYLDEQSAQLPNRNLDVYAADLERVEVLEGPQGTLFGAGAEAGVIRYITNKPKLNVQEGNVNASYGTTAHGDNNSAIDAMINIPIIEDTLAVRGVIYNDQRGGYINNVPSTFARSGWDLGLASYNGGTKNAYGRVTSPGVVPADSQVINNYLLAANHINPLTYEGIRTSALWKINNDWDALLTQTYQNMNAQGVFYTMPSTGGGKYGVDTAYFNPSQGLTGGNPLPPLSVSLFTPSYNKDKFTNTALTVNGQLGVLKAVYDGAYLVRNVEQQTDYTNYARGLFGPYYQCTGFSSSFNPPSKCYSPAAIWTDTERLVHWSNEIRISTPDDRRIRGLLGLYYEKYSIYDDTEWLYRSVPECAAPTATDPLANTNCFLPIQPWPGAPANDPNVRNPQTGFFDDVQRGYKQKAAFASIDFDLIPRVLTITGGTRYFKFEEWANGGDVGSFYCKFYNPPSVAHSFGPCTTGAPPAGNNNAFNSQFYPGPPWFIPGNQSGGSAYGPFGTNLTGSSRDETGTRSRTNLSWHVTNEALLYYTFSQGYAPGGFNRGTSGRIAAGYAAGTDVRISCGHGTRPACQFYTPLYWSSDTLTNNEVGWKTEWLNRTLVLNGAVYQEKWTNVQTQFFDPLQGLGNLAFNTNGPNYTVKGIEIQFMAQPVRGLSITGAAAWNSSEQTNSPSLINNNPYCTPTTGPYNPTPCIPGYGHPISGLPSPYGAPGSRLAMSPPFEGYVHGRYEWALDSYKAYCQASANRIGETISQTGNVLPFTMPGYTTYDASAGIGKGAWIVEAYGQNLTNVLASTYTNSTQLVVTETTLHPRILGVKVSYAFSGSAK
jgi:outer membrane receptor protein involved in Fe transport